MSTPLTGRKVFLFTAAAFGLIIGVNVVMAVMAVRTFPGLEVKSSYVASQSFDRDRKAQEALGWTLSHDYTGSELILTIRDRQGYPADVRVLSALVGRATEAGDDVTPVFAYESGSYRAPLSLGQGKWIVVLDASAADGTRYRKRLELTVGG
jgi:nitrogen fixation protein FixH